MRTLAALAVLTISTPAFADVSGGCRCDTGTLGGIALALPIFAVGALLARARR
jgi:hypothetical protein